MIAFYTIDIRPTSGDVLKTEDASHEMDKTLGDMMVFLKEIIESEKKAFPKLNEYSQILICDPFGGKRVGKYRFSNELLVPLDIKWNKVESVERVIDSAGKTYIIYVGEER